jgi:hypothetical protein
MLISGNKLLNLNQPAIAGKGTARRCLVSGEGTRRLAGNAGILVSRDVLVE